jgi:hypothetical protein
MRTPRSACFASLIATCAFAQCRIPEYEKGRTLEESKDSGPYSPKAKVIFLAACGLDDAFIKQWTLSKNQALITPDYFTNNTFLEVNLINAAWEWQSMVLTLADGKSSVQAAVDEANRTAKVQHSQYQWKVAAGKPNVTVR